MASSDEFCISLTNDVTAISPVPNWVSFIFKILSPGCKPEIDAAFSGCIAKTKIPGSGSKGIPILPTFIIKIVYARIRLANTPAEITYPLKNWSIF